MHGIQIQLNGTPKLAKLRDKQIEHPSDTRALLTESVGIEFIPY